MRSTQIQTAFLVVLLSAGALGAATTTITIDASKPGPDINPRMYGIFLEEINHGVDGGLYGELIRNRAFEDARPPEGYVFRDGRWRDTTQRGFDSGFSRYGYTTNGAPFWSLVQDGGAKGSMHLETTGGITEQSAYCLQLDVEDAATGRIGVANGGFFGIGVKAGASYTLSLYARGGDGFNGPLKVRLEDTSGAPVSDEAVIEGMGTSWKQFKATLRGSKADNKARLVITAGAKGRVWLDFVSLFPTETWKNRPNGLRPDIAQMIADLKPGFVRFPGGCVVDAGTVETAYNWKLTVGLLEERQERWGPWNYRRTQGVGLFEYLQLCEDLGAEPLWVGFAGQTCIHRERELVPMSDMGWVRDNFLDIIEYANGPVDSRWGALRARAGHPSPFGLKHVEIGNENNGPEFGERYRFIYDAMKAKYPELNYFADLSFTSRRSMGDAVFDIEDRHHYRDPRWFVSRFNEYDERTPAQKPLYLGELATTSSDAGPTRGNLRAALAEGVYLMGCERNGDVVRMVSYAPLLGHIEGRTELTGAPPPWHAMIYFDGTRVFGTASYHLWKLFGHNVPSRTLKTEVVVPGESEFKVAGQIGLGTWDTTAEFKDVRVEKNGQVLYASDFAQGAEGWQAAGRGRRGGGSQWTVQDGAFRQGQRGRSTAYNGEADWSDYTLTLKARKLSGGEGFLIVFGRRGTDMFWWNLGGWGNTQHAIEHSIDGGQTAVGAPMQGRIETERWYDIKIELRGKHIRCYLDGKLTNEGNAEAARDFFASAGKDDATGDLVVKAINLRPQPAAAVLKLDGVDRITSQATVTLLKSTALTDNNTLDDPLKVAPSVGQFEGARAQFPFEFAPNSFTVIRLKSR